MQLWISSSLESRSPVVGGCGKLAGADQLGENFRRVALPAAHTAGDDVVQIVLEIGDSGDAGIELLPAQHRLERAEDGERPARNGSRSSGGMPSMSPISATGMAAAKSAIEIDLALLRGGLEQAIDKRSRSRPCSARNARGVKAGASSLRTRV